MNQAIPWMLVSTALVSLMTPALAFFYGGLVRSKNALNTMMMSFISLGFVGVLWAVVGYSLAFAPGNNYLGDLSRLGLNGVGLEAQGTIPHYLFMAYQGTFAIITAALISGAIVERMRFSAYLVFIILVAAVLTVAHWYGARRLGVWVRSTSRRPRALKRLSRRRGCDVVVSGRLSELVAASAQCAVTWWAGLLLFGCLASTPQRAGGARSRSLRS